MKQKSFFSRLRCLGFVLFSLFFTQFVAVPASGQSNEGKEFIVGFLPNPLVSNTVEVHLTAQTATQVTVEYPVNSPTFSSTVDVTPGNITIVEIDVNASLGWPENAVANNAVRMSASVNFIAYLINRASATSDAALGLPIDTFNRDYIVITNHSSVGGLFTVVAAYDDTVVSITPSNNLEGGRAAGVPFEITLQRGEGYLGQEDGSSLAGLTGTIISADKPVGVTNGNVCSNMPVGACDHNFETAHPIQSWGTSVLAANLPNRGVGAAYRIVASEDDTAVSRDGVGIGVINRAQFLDIGQTPDDFVISADKPIFAIQIQPGSSGGDPGPIGDPATGNLIPPEQFRTNYTFSTLPEVQFPANFVIVTANNSDVGTITLDGSPIGAGQFVPIGSSSYSVARLAVGGGVHTTVSDNPHGIMALGYGSFDSYQFPGGAQLGRINPGNDLLSPICSVKEEIGPPPFAVVGGNDVQPEDTGIFTVELLDGAVNLEIETPFFVPGEGTVLSTVRPLNLEAAAQGVVRFTDGSGNSCDAEVALNTRDCIVNLSSITEGLGKSTRVQTRTLRSLRQGLSRTACARDQTSLVLSNRAAGLLRKARKTSASFIASLPEQYDICQAQVVCAQERGTSARYLNNTNRVQKLSGRILKKIEDCGRNGVCRGPIAECVERVQARLASYNRTRRTIRASYNQIATNLRDGPVQVASCQ